MSKEDNKKKIIIMGMENAGKSTIVKYLKISNYEIPENPPDMNPTNKVERTVLADKNLIIWDFGGQEVYRNEYLEKPESYFHSVSYFYYVIDVQDYYRLFSSAMYFMAIYNVISKYSLDARIVLLFHKWDPEFDPKKKNLKEKFLEKVQPYLEKRNTAYLMFDTSIFSPNTIKSAFNIDLIKTNIGL